jgi:hypothetical protein
MYQDPKLPVTFEVPENLIVEAFSYGGKSGVSVRDYAKDDDFREFEISLRVEPAPEGKSAADLVAGYADSMKGAGGYADVQPGPVAKVRVMDRDGARFTATYTWKGGREYFTRPDGEERHTGEGPLKKKVEGVVIPLGDTMLTITLDVSLAQEARRRPVLDRVLSTLKAAVQAP